ncbi:MAG: hypothetical protein QNK05_11860 [Myxococcota bacterium]|nr:hypothetical protein [Myxococcota bacterium]
MQAVLLLGLAGAASANPFVVDVSGAGLSLAEGCLVSESFCDPTDANQNTLVADAVATGTFSFSGVAPGPQTLTFNLDVASATLDGTGPTVDEIELTNFSLSGTVNVNITPSFGAFIDISLTGPQTVTASGTVEASQGGGSLGSTAFSTGVTLSSLTCNFFSGVGGGLCGVTAIQPGDLQVSVGGQDLSIESFAYNPTLALPEPALAGLVLLAGAALVGARRRA